MPSISPHVRYWIFDLDGTLTVEVHDFAAIRRMLGLPPGKGILETLAELEPERAEPLWKKLEDHESELARIAEPATGAASLLDALTRRESRLGIFTRNSRRNVETTLAATGLARYFEPSGFVTRETGRPKPHPEGIFRLLELWGAAPDASVMVGNHRHDLDAGRAAGIMTIHVDTESSGDAGIAADLQVASLAELASLLP